MAMDSKTVGVCPRCGHPVHWMWAGNSAKTRKECGCCGYRGFAILRKLDADGARDTVRAMHEWAVRDWKQEAAAPASHVRRTAMSLIGPCCLYAMTELADLTGAKTSPPPLSSGFCATDDWFGSDWTTAVIRY